MDVTIEPDTKDWTWILQSPCPECGFDPLRVDLATVSARVRATVPLWADVLASAGSAQRPAPTTWSATEYACHVRDVCTIFAERIELMLREDDPEFANWDQDETAVEQRYDLQLPATVTDELAAAAQHIASVIDAVPEGSWDRPGWRSNGSVFTVATLVVYFLHDLEHHLVDVGSPQ